MQRGGSDFAAVDLARVLESIERNKAIVVCDRYAQDKQETLMFLQMLDLLPMNRRDLN